VVSSAKAQNAPDAGKILRQQPQLPALPKPAPAKPAHGKPETSPPAAAEATVEVKGFRIFGNTLIPEAELLDQLKDLAGKSQRFDELLVIRLRLTAYYADKGYLARVFLPPQEIRDGILEVRIVEGTRGDIHVESKAARVKADRVRRFIEARAPAGALLDTNAVGEALNILNEQPGVRVTSALAAGKTESAVDMNVTAADRPLATFDLAVNNQGARATGTGQITASVSLANPTGLFDQVSALVNRSEGSSFGRVDYSLAVGDRGLRAGVSLSALSYQLVQPDFSALQARGTAYTAGLRTTYPILRRDDLSLTIDAGVDTKQFQDRTVNGETGDRRVTVANAGLSGFSAWSRVSGLTVVTFSGTLAGGSLNQRNSAALAADLAARRTEGSYRKIAYDLGLLHTFGRGWSLAGSFRGQQADKNLDSSERLSLGGANAVRAYPLGEATGDEGWVIKADLKHRLRDGWRAGVFYDAGGITQNHTLPPAGLATPNRYTLGGAGLVLEWLPRPDISMTFTIASPVGNNPGKSAAGTNIDGSRSNASRGWFGLLAWF
jgi:hemolysin activation/secretion protein